MDESYEVVGIGHALLDASFAVHEAFLQEQGLSKGQMTLCNRTRLVGLRAALPKARSCSAGGSCSNTLALLGRLGARATFVGRVGDDDEGRDFRRSMEQSSVSCRLEVAAEDTGTKQDERAAAEEKAEAEEEAAKGEATGQCLVFVTEDAERSFATYLGASSGIVAEHVDKALLDRTRCLYLEGYLLGGEEDGKGRKLFQSLAEVCGRMSLSLSDVSCVLAHRNFLVDFVHSHVDLLFANEEEACALFAIEKTSDKRTVRDALMRSCAALGCRVCLTLGAEGALLFDDAGGMVVSRACAPVRCLDTTGAGDAFAAGVLFGLSRGWSLARAGDLANRLGGAVTAEVGPRLTLEVLPLLRASEQSHALS